MKITSLQMKNFRCFEDTTIHFHEQLTVLVGVNGSGKTALLEAISMILENVLRYALTEALPSLKYQSSNFLSPDDTTYHVSDSVALHAIFDVLGNSYTWTDPLIESEGSSSINAKTNLTIRNIKYGGNSNPQLIELILKELKFNFPVMSYYSVFRLLLNAYPADESPYERRWMDAYENCFAPVIGFEKALTWFKGEEFNELTALRDGRKEAAKELVSVRKAVNIALPEYHNVRCINNPPELVVTRKRDGQTIPFAQLSGGYRAMLALIFDLARRMAVANGKSETFAKSGMPSLLHSPAIVLIDEVELHLHPSWQQTVLPSLMDIFPNTQFIVTTHSPQVISSVEPQHVRILKDGKVLPVETSTFGAESSRVLEEVFGVSVRPHNEAIRALDEYLKLINDGEGHSEGAKALRHKLDIWLADDPILDRADMFIIRSDRQKAREEKPRA